MSKTFKAKVRAVGTSLGVLIPKEVVKKEKVKKGEEIEVGLLKRELRATMRLFGAAEGASGFKRDHTERKI